MRNFRDLVKRLAERLLMYTVVEGGVRREVACVARLAFAAMRSVLPGESGGGGCVKILRGTLAVPVSGSSVFHRRAFV